jgi:signal transduction histidine kinase
LTTPGLIGALLTNLSNVETLSLLSVVPVLCWLTDRFRREREGTVAVANHSNGGEQDVIARLQREVKRLRSLLVDTANLNATLNYERVLEMTLDLANSALEGAHDSRLVSALLMFDNNHMYVASARGLPQADLRVNLPGQYGVLGETLTTLKPSMCSNPSNDPELKRFVAFHNSPVAICIPLVVGLEIYGVLIFGHADERFFSADRVEVLEAIAHQGMIALQNARLYRDLEQEKERIAEIQEDARRKLARDLHDGPTQSIGAIAMRVNFARRLVQRDPEKAGEELFKIEELARRTTKEIRQMLFTLRPLVLESEGLVEALRQLAEKTLENHEQNVIVEAKDNVVADMEVGKQGVIFFIVEEAVSNARKHARAKHIWVRLKKRSDVLQLEIEDDGVGFDVVSVQANYEQRGSLGMINLYERTELVNGILKFDSKPGRGTRITVAIPMTNEAAEKLHRPGYVV